MGLTRGPSIESLIEAARRDKKNRDGRIHCALPVRLGRMPAGDAVTVAVDEQQLAEVLEDASKPRAD